MALKSLTADRRLAERIDKKVTKILKHGGNEVGVLTGLTSYMNDFKVLMDSTSRTEMDLLCERYDGFYKYAKILENLASGISSGKIQVP